MIEYPPTPQVCVVNCGLPGNECACYRYMMYQAEREAEKKHNTFFYMVESAIEEAERAMKLYPQPNYVITKIAEEAGEVVQASVHCAEGRGELEQVRKEMQQLIAMCYRLWMEGDQVHKLPPVGPDIGPTTKLNTTEIFFGELEKAAQQSNWIPDCYTANDWVSDCARFLRYGY